MSTNAAQGPSQDPDRRLLDWSHVYLLGWLDGKGTRHLTAWSGNRPTETFVITGPWQVHGPPLWSATHNFHAFAGGSPVDRFGIHAIPDGEDPVAVADRLGGCLAIGWYIEDGFERGRR